MQFHPHCADLDKTTRLRGPISLFDKTPSKAPTSLPHGSREPPSTSSNSSKSKMFTYTPYFDQYITSSGPKRSVELRYHNTHEICPPSTATVPVRRQSHSRGKRASKEGRSKSRSPRTEDSQTRVPKGECRPEVVLLARPLLDGRFPVEPPPPRTISDISAGSWEFLRPDADSSTAPLKGRKPKSDIYDPSFYIGTPETAEVSDYNWLSDYAVPGVDEEVINSDGSDEYHAQAEYPDTSDTSQPAATIAPPPVDWNDAYQIQQQQQQEEILSHHPHLDTTYNQASHTNPRLRHTGTKHKRRESFRAARRESFMAPSSTQLFLRRFFFPHEFREAAKEEKIRNDRVDLWLEGLLQELVAKEIAQQTQEQQYPDIGGHERAAAPIGYDYPHSRQY